ncbi:thiamine diphosphokinase [Saccharibacillus sp. CPCC 101409]|uniref:thiamine diphosphokinase n=1 Tax=Saccharibacillus sp. CPCC 101409 TaxID=3058041 RepID=UPI002672C763|nr:thiamine diphosphokinase [Saccharibacillus sp. CPCC 101409]MDO3412853.1 thiamine diphosphokinase [Saccharibacillus sp. CPCC 101409]
MNAKRIVIVSGGPWTDDYLRELRPDDMLIGADRGALQLIENGLRPDVAVGDFDSVSPADVERIRSASGRIDSCDPIDKNYTDTELAFELALNERPSEILMLGVTGGRMDHTLANVQLLIRALRHQIVCSIRDHNNYIQLTGSQLTVHNQGFTYVSLIPATMEVGGVTLEGFEYPLKNATLRQGQSLSVSNKLAAPEGIVSIESGLLLVIQSRD